MSYFSEYERYRQFKNQICEGSVWRRPDRNNRRFRLIDVPNRLEVSNGRSITYEAIDSSTGQVLSSMTISMKEFIQLIKNEEIVKV